MILNGGKEQFSEFSNQVFVETRPVKFFSALGFVRNLTVMISTGP
jgi:hypothetical protein